MANAPIFPATPKVSWGVVSLGNTNYDGTGNVSLLFTAGVTGARVDTLKALSLGTNEATVFRLFLNNGSTTETSANNSLILELTFSAVTTSQTSALTSQEEVLDFAIPSGYCLYGAVGVTLTNGYQITILGGDY